MENSRDIGLLRLVAQRIAGSGFARPVDVVRWLVAMQAQDYGGALTSVALRMSGGKRGDVEAALDAGEIVRSWPMRGTLHFVAAEDLAWMLGIAAPRLLAGAANRRAQLDLDQARLDRARDVAVAALQDVPRLRRGELMAVWDDAGLATSGGRGYHLLWYLALTGVVCLGPVVGNEQQIVLADAWIREPRRLTRDEALGEWVSRYFRSHGPATVKDFARWSGLRAADIGVGLAIAKPHLAIVGVGDVTYFMDAETPDLLAELRREAQEVFLLPGFDEFVLGYADRSTVLAPEFAERIVPGSNGVFKPVVVVGGRIAGTWRHVGRGASRSVDSTAFTRFSARVLDAIGRAHAVLP